MAPTHILNRDARDGTADGRQKLRVNILWALLRNPTDVAHGIVGMRPLAHLPPRCWRQVHRRFEYIREAFKEAFKLPGAGASQFSRFRTHQKREREGRERDA